MSSTYTTHAYTKDHVKHNMKSITFPTRGVRFTYSKVQALHLGTVFVLCGTFKGLGNDG